MRTIAASGPSSIAATRHRAQGRVLQLAAVALGLIGRTASTSAGAGRVPRRARAKANLTQRLHPGKRSNSNVAGSRTDAGATERALYTGFIRLHILHYACEGKIYGLEMSEELRRQRSCVVTGIVRAPERSIRFSTRLSMMDGSSLSPELLNHAHFLGVIPSVIVPESRGAHRVRVVVRPVSRSGASLQR